MALGALSLGNNNVGLDAAGSATAMGGVATGNVGTIEIKSPLDTLKDTFTSMQESLGAMVGIQTKEAKRQEIIDKKLLEQRDFEIKMMNEKFADSGAAGAPMPDSNDDLAGVDTDDKTYGNFVEKAENVSGNILDTIKEAFSNVSFGPKMTAILFAGGLVLFMKYKDQLTKVLTPIVQFVMDAIDFLGPGGAFAVFLGGFILLKSGLAKKGIMKAGSLILKGIKASAAAIDRQGGLLKAMGNGFEKINRGMTSIVGGAKKTGTFITTNLTKGFDKLGAGVKAMNKGVGGAVSKLGGGFSKLFGFVGKGFMMIKVGMMSMLSSITPMIAPLLPVIAIAVGIAAVLYSLKSGFDTFKEALDNGDSMLVAIGKGVMDAMMTLVLLPVTLIKKLVGFVAGLLGFDNFKESLEGFSIKDKIVGAFKSLTGGMFKIVKAIAKGVVAALAAALPGGKTPQEEFARAYQEVMKGGEGKSEIETQKMKGGEETGDANVAESFYANNVPKFAMKKMNRTDLMNQDNDILNEFKTDKMGNPLKLLPGESMTSTTMKTETIKKEGKVVSSKQDVVVVKGGDVKQGDTINQMSQTTIGGDLEVNNQERTQRAIQELAAF